ncbi:MBL fold metallo-hydrolase [Desulforamulus ruminis]|uniref:Beta-lactamase domain-containing protein n=1 Tax=Desulforamulus ruminis (strain ATCC 23193 / DSM 2154 / NCIMB 8452 / DL) TaxID=696281 RepID=F6DNB2_DESRL|nr:MBL fold metallo-hydrolase [Desulforamulus ruminis]AEG61803.1 beta-lactamase domain-containing protein [Desulforamulus ruminis DSM 2154]
MTLEKMDADLRKKTAQAAAESFSRWRHREEPEASPPGVTVTFLGTGGNPEAVFSQVPHTAGFVLMVEGVRLYVDPGPGAVVRAKDAGIDLGTLDAVYISHGHLDHYAGAEAVIEGMCWGMFSRRGYLLAPGQVLERDHLLSRYHQGLNRTLSGYKGGPTVVPLEPNRPITLKNITLTPVPVHHAGENYGFILDTGGMTIGYTSDTSYIQSYTTPTGVVDMGWRGPIMDLIDVVDCRKDIKEAFSQVDVLIANVTTHNVYAHRHITTLGLSHLLQHSRVKLCFITHFNHCCLWPEDLRPAMAQFVEKKTGIPTLYAEDGGVYNISQQLGPPGEDNGSG